MRDTSNQGRRQAPKRLKLRYVVTCAFVDDVDLDGYTPDATLEEIIDVEKRDFIDAVDKVLDGKAPNFVHVKQHVEQVD